MNFTDKRAQAPTIKRFTVEEYHRLGELGFFAEGDRVELIRLENVLETYSEPYQKLQGEFGYRLKRVLLPNEAIALPHFPDLILDLSRTFPAKVTN